MNKSANKDALLKIALLGYGKMGKAIEAAAMERGHSIVLKINSSNSHECSAANLLKADIAIEFSNPENAVTNIYTCMDAGIPVVCGSTGWLHQWENVMHYCNEKKGGFLYASNFSIGVNIFFEVNKKLAELMSKQSAYDAKIEEIHHTQKKDAPSGTAITLAEQLIQKNTAVTSWIKGAPQNKNQLPVYSKREDPAPGTHSVIYHSDVDEIEIKHTAFSRQGFATGAVMAAEYLHLKKGIFSMQDVLGF